MNIKKDFLILTRNVKLKNKSGSVALNTTFKFPRWAIITMTFLYHPPELFSLLFFRKYIAIFYGCLRPRHIKQKPEPHAPAFVLCRLFNTHNCYPRFCTNAFTQSKVSFFTFPISNLRFHFFL